MHRLTKFILLAVVLLAFLIRVVGISSFPVGFTQDEAAIGYDAYSLLLTGKDQWGTSWPLVLRSFGDFKMPLYSYLAIPSIAIFGLNEFGVRLPSAIIGTLAVLATFLMSRQLFRNNKLEIGNKRSLALRAWKLEILAPALLAISPWHISLSRGAFEANLTTFFIPLGIWAYFSGLEKPKYLIISAMAFGLNLFSYHSARIFTILILPTLIIISRKEIKSLFKNQLPKILPSLVVVGVFFLLLIISFLTGANRRAQDITIFNPTDKWAAVSDRRYEAVLQGLSTEKSRIFSNKLTYLFHRFTSNYFSYFSPNFLFTEGVSEWSYGMIPGRGVLYTLEIIPILIGIAYFLKSKDPKNIKLLLLWIVFAPVPAALSKGAGGSGTRVAVMMPAIQILSAYGIVSGIELLKKIFKNIALIKFSYVLVIGLYLISLIFFIEDYRYHANVRGAKFMQYGMKEVVGYISEADIKYDEILLSRSLSVPNIWVQFYLKVDPAQVHKASQQWLVYEDQGYVSIDQMGQYFLGKYTFSGIDKEKLSGKKDTLVIGKPEEFKVGQEALKFVKYPDGTPAFLIVDASRM